MLTRGSDSRQRLLQASHMALEVGDLLRVHLLLLLRAGILGRS
jgi:hypothetical protein